MLEKPNVHFTHSYLLRPTNPVMVNIIGAGGTGSQLLTALARMHFSLRSLGHTGLMIQLFDDDRVTKANLGRQLFSTNDIGQYKASVLISRVNRFFGSAFKAIPHRFEKANNTKLPEEGAANITISCVDAVSARFEIASLLKELRLSRAHHQHKPMYWLDIGNSQYTGQVVLSTVGNIAQPSSKKYNPIADLPFITEEYNSLLSKVEDDQTPSCSLADALQKQDLYINSTLSSLAASMLWTMMRDGMTMNRGCFLHLKQLRMQPLPVSSSSSILDK